MKVSIWYHVDERLPPQPGFYLTYVEDSDQRIEYNYYNGPVSGWARYKGLSTWLSGVRFWTDINLPAMLEDHVANYQEQPGEREAREQVEQAVERYEIIRALAK